MIRERILDGRSAPGDRLVIEHLAREINVSVVPVREAIRRLEAEGYVTFTRNVGATVTSIDLDRYPETVEALAVLEGVAIGLAAPHLTATDIKKARALNEELRRSVDKLDPLRFTETNQQFHRTLYERCPNRHIVNMVVREWALIETTRRSAFSFIPERAIGSVAEHEQLLAADRDRETGRGGRGVRPPPPDAHGPLPAPAPRRRDGRGGDLGVRFRSDPASIRGSIAPVVTPFTDDGERRPRRACAASSGGSSTPARTGSRSVARPVSRAPRPSPSASPRCGSRPRRWPTGCPSCRAPARPSSTRPWS